MANEFVARNGVIAKDDSIVTGSLIVTAGITGSLFGTSSYALTASLLLGSVVSASYASTASYFGGNSTIPALQSRRTGSYTLTATYADLTFDANDYSGDITIISHSIAGTTERFYIKEAGPYLVTYNYTFGAAGSVGYDSEARVFVNNVTFASSSYAQSVVSSTDDSIVTKTFIYNFAATDYFTVQTKYISLSGGSITANTATVNIVRLNAVAAGAGGGSSFNGLKGKSGAVTNTSFTGSPRKATVTFSSAFTDTSYGVVITGADLRSWTIESKTAGSFVINSNSSTALTGDTYWSATAYGETT